MMMIMVMMVMMRVDYGKNGDDLLDLNWTWSS
jgi:uncharacterized protein involved in response to NO